MNTTPEIVVNKVAQSGILTIDLATYLPNEPQQSIDIAEYLFMKMILKEKSFREQLSSTDFTVFASCHVHIYCSVDAIIPSWAYMLLVDCLQSHAKSVFVGTAEQHLQYLVRQNIEKIDTTPYVDARVVIKGCGDKTLPVDAYAAISAKLLTVVKSLMYGEPCSTVPIYKRKNIVQ